MERTICLHPKDGQAHLHHAVALPVHHAIQHGIGTAALHAHAVTEAHVPDGRERHVTRKVRGFLRGGQRGEVVVGGHAVILSQVRSAHQHLFFFFLCALRLTTRRLFDIIVGNALQELCQPAQRAAIIPYPLREVN